MSVTREQVQPYISDQYSEDETRELIQRYVETQPIGTGIARARIRGTGTTVAAIIMVLQAEGGNVERAAWQYNLSVKQVLAAVFYYWEHQEVIDAEITVRDSWFND